jgi:hypothetical protein
MENNKPELSLEELKAKHKKMKGAVIGLGIVILFTCSILIYFIVKNKNYVMVGVAIPCLFSLLPSILALKQMEKEIKSREQ